MASPSSSQVSCPPSSSHHTVGRPLNAVVQCALPESSLSTSSPTQAHLRPHSWTGQRHQSRLARLPLESFGITLAKANLEADERIQHQKMSLSYNPSKRHSALARSDAGSAEQGPPRNVSKEQLQWWENVLPPGQLAERLRKAQTSEFPSVEQTRRTSPRNTLAVRHSNGDSTAERSRTGSSASTHSRHVPLDAHTYLSPPATITNRSRAGTWSSHQSQPSSSTRSSISIGESSSASSSNDEGSSITGQHSPLLLADDWPSYGFSSERSSGTTSPTHSITRSQSNRRRRVLGSEDGTGLGVNMRGSKGHLIDLDERFHQWNNGLPFLPAASHQDKAQYYQPSSSAHGQQGSATLGLRPFPSSSSSTSSRHGAVFVDTPDGSSEEDRAAQKSTRRATRTSSTHTADTIREGQTVRRSGAGGIRTSAPSSRRSSIVGGTHQQISSAAQRRVSFNQDVEVVQGNDVLSTQTIGRAHGRSLSSMNEKLNHTTSDFSRVRQRFNSHAVHQAHDADVRAHAHSHVRGKRTPCHSAPTSPKLANAQLHKEQRGPSRLGQESIVATSSTAAKDQSAEEAASAAELAILSSLSLAQSQLSSARNIALTLTRQLSAPLRPVFHLTLLASISSMAFMALAGFLVAGYLCTVWDDVNSRGKSLHRNVSTARQTIERRVQWTRGLLGINDVGGESQDAAQTATSSTPSASAKDGQSSRKSHARTSSHSATASKIFFAPFTLAFALPAAVVYYLTPQGVRAAFASTGRKTSPSSSKASFSSTYAHRRATSSATSSSGFHNLPPRPPLSSLLPSIAFTIVIACGAGLASFFATKNAAEATPTHSARATPNSSAPPSPSIHGPHHSRTSSASRFDVQSSSAHSSPSSSHVRRRSTQVPPSSSFNGAEPIGFRHVHLDGRRSPFAVRTS